MPDAADFTLSLNADDELGFDAGADVIEAPRGKPVDEGEEEDGYDEDADVVHLIGRKMSVWRGFERGKGLLRLE